MSAPTPTAQRILHDVFGYDSFREGQQAVIETLLARRHVLAVMPTGSGKSLCFQIPALVFGGLAVVVSPLVALMQDQVAALQLAGVAADSINSAKPREENVAVWRRVVAGETRLLYMAPERLMTERMLAALARLPLSLFAVDEAHCISQWGPSFRREYEDLCRLRTCFPGVPIAALTATADGTTRDDIAQRLFGGAVEQLVLGFDRPNIRLAVTMKRDWKRQLRDFIARHRGESGIVYCLSRKKTEETAALLQADGVPALPYHAGVAKREREAHQNTFMTDPGVVMVATIAFGMGIDKSNVRFVFHADLPGSLEAYYQEIGRAGRDGAPAEAHMLYGLADIRMRRQFVENEDAGDERRRREHKRLDALLAYCEAPTCRRVVLLAYFGQQTEPCGNCDSCLSPSERLDGTAEARSILAAVQQSGERYGAAHVIDILRGTQTDKIERVGHHRLPCFGVGAGRSRNEWHSLIRQLVATSVLQLDIAAFGGLAVTSKGLALLNGEGTFLYRVDAVAPRPPGPSRSSTRRSREAEVPLTESQQDLLDRLKALRLQLAKERQVPAYIVFPDRALVDMARRCPRTVEAFGEVNGVGVAKQRDFATPFLAVIRDALDQG